MLNLHPDIFGNDLQLPKIAAFHMTNNHTNPTLCELCAKSLYMRRLNLKSLSAA